MCNFSRWFLHPLFHLYMDITLRKNYFLFIHVHSRTGLIDCFKWQQIIIFLNRQWFLQTNKVKTQTKSKRKLEKMKHQFKKTRKTNLVILVKHFHDGILNLKKENNNNFKELFCYATMNLNISNIEYESCYIIHFISACH